MLDYKSADLGSSNIDTTDSLNSLCDSKDSLNVKSNKKTIKRKLTFFRLYKGMTDEKFENIFAWLDEKGVDMTDPTDKENNHY